jgi:hypothetical protein
VSWDQVPFGTSAPLITGVKVGILFPNTLVTGCESVISTGEDASKDVLASEGDMIASGV